jgi:beta propeller repeat protein
VLASLLVSLLAIVHVASAAITTQEILITEATSNQLSPVIEISGNMVVWEDYRNGNGDIYAYNLSVAAELQITSVTSTQRKPAISSNIIVWEDDRNGNWDIYGYDLATQTMFQVTSDTNTQRKAEVSGTTIVWEDDRNGSWDVYRYDTVTRQEIAVATGSGDQKRPEISGNTIVWENGNGDIHGLNLASGPMFVVTDSAGWQDMPAISGSTVVWRDDRNGNYDIYGRTLPTGGEFAVSDELTDEVAPAMSEWSSSISGLVVVWTDTRNGDADIFGKDLATGEDFTVTIGAGHDDLPAISGKYVVWERQRPNDPEFGSYDIYGAILIDSDAPGVTANLASGIYGSAQTVTLTPDEPATVYYTTDGSAPTTSSLKYSGPININQEGTTTLNFLAVDRGNNASPVMSEWYTIDTTDPTVSADPPGGTTGGPQTVTLTAADATATNVYFTTNGSAPTDQSALYITPISITSDTTLKFLGIDAAGNQSNIVTETYSVDQTAPIVTANPSGGTFISSQSVTLSANEAATIYYCRTAGCTVSTGSTLYSGPISITATTTLKFIGVDAFGNQSEAVVATYTINEVSSSPVITQAPATVLKAARLGTTSVPAVISWAGTDDVAVTSYQLQRRVNGGSWGNIALSPVTATSKTLFVSPGKSYEFRVLARDADGNASAYANGPVFDVVASQEQSPAITYTGTWAQVTLSGAFGGQVKHSSTNGSKATITFNGTSISWISTKAKAHGKAEVWLDGVKVATVDLYRSSTQARMTVFTRNNLTPGSHTLEIRVLGTKRTAATSTRVDVDAFIVLN